MRELGHYILKGEIRKYTRDSALQRALLKSCHERLLFVQGMEIKEQNARFVFENIFRSIIEGINANIVAEGFLSETEESSIAYLQKYRQKFSQPDLDYLDRLMKINENLRKYAVPISAMEAKQALMFARKIIPVLKGLSTAGQFYRLE